MLAYAIAAALLLQSEVGAAQSETNGIEAAAQSNATLWGNDDVENYLSTFGPLSGEEDPFVAPVQPAFPDQVVLEFPVDQSEHGLFRWTYDREAKAMTLVVTEEAREASQDEHFGGVRERGFQHVIRGRALTLHRDSQVRHHSSGANYRLLYSRGFGEVYRQGSGQIERRVFRHTFSIEPEAARALSSELVLRISGKPRPWRDDTRIICETNYRGLEAGFVTLSCFLTGVLETYQVIDRRDGTVIHEWDVRQPSNETPVSRVK